jgi:hypothetical protein
VARTALLAGLVFGLGLLVSGMADPAKAMQLPADRTTIDRRLLGGALLLGIGWGLAGFCPGPALVALGMGEPQAALFVAAMLAGMALSELLGRRPAAAPAAAPSR